MLDAPEAAGGDGAELGICRKVLGWRVRGEGHASARGGEGAEELGKDVAGCHCGGQEEGCQGYDEGYC